MNDRTQRRDELEGPVPLREIRVAYVASPGPGGQNVNKVATKAVLRWNLAASQAFSEEQKLRLSSHALLRRRVNSAGEVVLYAAAARSQRTNYTAAVRRLQELVTKALRPRTPRKKTRPPRSAKEGRLREKRLHSRKKDERRKDVGGEP